MHFVGNFLRIRSKLKLLTSQAIAATNLGLRCDVGKTVRQCSEFHTLSSIEYILNIDRGLSE